MKKVELYLCWWLTSNFTEEIENVNSLLLNSVLVPFQKFSMKILDRIIWVVVLLIEQNMHITYWLQHLGAQSIQTFHLGVSWDYFIFLHWRCTPEHFIMLRPYRPPWRHIWDTRAAVLIIFSQRKRDILNPYRNCRDFQAGSVPVGGTRLSWLYQFEKYFPLFCTAFKKNVPIRFASRISWNVPSFISSLP